MTFAAATPKTAAMLRACALALLLFAACGDEPDPDPPVGGTNACGNVGTTTGSECTGLDECGAGAANMVKPSFCDHCFARADSHFCEAGTCRPVAMGGDTGFIRFITSLPDGVSGAMSFTQASLLPVAADGTRLTCAKLLSTCSIDGNRNLNATNSNFKTLILPPGADSFRDAISSDPGPDRLYVMQVTSESQGKGTVLAVGCVEGISVTSGQTTDITVELRTP